MPEKLGQNFLNNLDIIEKIISHANSKDIDCVLEIGPGKGILTDKLVEKFKQVLAVELDAKLFEFLTQKFQATKNLSLFNYDILKVNIPELVSKNPYCVIANIPYYITAPIIRLFLENPAKPQEMILMIQKEVAERIVATAGQMSILAIAVQYYAQAEILFTVTKENFTPSPKVDSAVIKIVPHNQNSLSPEKEKLFFGLVRAGFSSKRKTLINNLSSSLQISKNVLEKHFSILNLSTTIRAQELSLEQWKVLFTMIC